MFDGQIRGFHEEYQEAIPEKNDNPLLDCCILQKESQYALFCYEVLQKEPLYPS